MKRKIYFEFSEISKAICKINEPIAVLSESLAPKIANTAFLVAIGIIDEIDMLLENTEIIKLYKAQKLHQDITVYYRKNAFESYFLDFVWTQCVYSNDYYCFCVARKDNEIESKKHYGELALIFSSLTNMMKQTDKYMAELEEFYTLIPDNMPELREKLDKIKVNYLSYNKIGSDVELLTKFMQEIWPVRKEYYNFHEAITRIIDEYRNTKCNKKATFKYNYNTEHAVVYCDMLYTTKAILNIISNLLKLSSSTNTTIHIDLDGDLSESTVSIYSTRLVLDEQEILDLLNGDELEYFGHEYLGIYIAYSIIRRQAGEFSFTSNAKEGTKVTFTMYLSTEKHFIFRSNPINPDFSYINLMAKEEFAWLI